MSASHATGLVLLGLLSLGCHSFSVVKGPASADPSPKTVAVLGFRQADGEPFLPADDGCIAGIVEAGARPIERMQFSELLKEKKLSRSEEGSPEFYQHLAEITGAEAFIVGSVASVDLLSKRPRMLTGRLVQARTGQVRLTARFGHSGVSGDPYEMAQRLCRGMLTGE